MTKFSTKLIKLFLAHFRPIFQIVKPKKNCSKNLARSRTASMPSFTKKLMCQFQENARIDQMRMEGLIDPILRDFFDYRRCPISYEFMNFLYPPLPSKISTHKAK